MVRKKTKRLLPCDYQRTARYYTIYRTFKRWSSDDFTTILRLLSIRLLRIYTYNCEYYATTIPAGTLRLLLASIGYRAKARKEMRREPPMVPRRPPRPCYWTALPGGGCQTTSRRAWEASNPRRADPVQVEALTPQQVRRVCTADSVSALASDPHTVGADPAAAGMVCDMLHRLAWIHDRSAPLHPLIYLIIIGGCADLYSVPAWRWYLVLVERVRARVCPLAWRGWYYSRFCRSCIVGG